MSHYHKLGNSHHVILLYSHKSNNASEFLDVFRARPITSDHFPSQKKGRAHRKLFAAILLQEGK